MQIKDKAKILEKKKRKKLNEINMADNELTMKLQKQISRNELNPDENIQPYMKVFNPYTEFKEFTRKEIQDLEKKFKT